MSLKITLPEAITSIPEAKTYLDRLFAAKLTYHPEDRAADVLWAAKKKNQPTPEECTQMDKLMEDIYNLEGNNGNHANPVFDPCLYILRQYKTFLLKDITGRGLTTRKDGNDLYEQFIEQTDEDTSEEEKEDFESFIDSAEDGETFTNYRGTIEITKLD